MFSRVIRCWPVLYGVRPRLPCLMFIRHMVGVSLYPVKCGWRNAPCVIAVRWLVVVVFFSLIFGVEWVEVPSHSLSLSIYRFTYLYLSVCVRVFARVHGLFHAYVHMVWVRVNIATIKNTLAPICVCASVCCQAACLPACLTVPCMGLECPFPSAARVREEDTNR